MLTSRFTSKVSTKKGVPGYAEVGGKAGKMTFWQITEMNQEFLFLLSSLKGSTESKHMFSATLRASQVSDFGNQALGSLHYYYYPLENSNHENLYIMKMNLKAHYSADTGPGHK